MNRLARAPENQESGKRNLLPAGVALLTLVAFVLRAPGINQSMFGDELFLFEIVSGHGASEVLDEVVSTESTPPLHFLLAWLAAQLGEPSFWFRLPSLLLGAALVPLTYALGAMTVGRAAGLVGSAVVALDPFAIFYSTEGRAYATLAFLTTASTIALLKGIRGGNRGWWIAFSIISWAALMTHYQAVFVIAGQGGWALWHRRDRIREVLVSYGAVALAYAAWLPFFFTQSQDSAANRGEALSPLTLESAFRDLGIVLAGHPFVALKEIPGRPALVAAGLGLAIAVAAALIAWARSSAAERRSRANPQLRLLVILAVATPLGGLLYSLGPGDVYVPRGLIPSLAPAALVIGALLVSPRPLVAIGATALVIGALGVGALKVATDPDYRRPPLRDVAELVDRQAGARDLVVDQPFFPLFSPEQLRRGLEAHLDAPHRVVKADQGGERAWSQVTPGHTVISVTPRVPGARTGPPRDLRQRFRLVERNVWRGWIPMQAVTYERR